MERCVHTFNVLKSVKIHIGDDMFTLLSVFLQALKMKYFSNRPGPTPGPQLPRPNCSVEALREKETVGLKRKIEGLETSNQHILSHRLYIS